MVLMLITMLFSLRAFSPDTHCLILAENTPVNPFKRVIYAVGMVEGKCDTLAYNVKEEATGYFQIRPCRVDDYNKRTGSHYTLNDMYDYEKAEKVFLYYASQYGPYRMDELIRAWNGSGPMTYDYLKRVKSYL